MTSTTTTSIATSNTRTHDVGLLSSWRPELVYKSLHLMCYHRSLDLTTTLYKIIVINHDTCQAPSVGLVHWGS
jgi:hypothetical protein